jgi:hypothetical protein
VHLVKPALSGLSPPQAAGKHGSWQAWQLAEALQNPRKQSSSSLLWKNTLKHAVTFMFSYLFIFPFYLFICWCWGLNSGLHTY